MSMPNIEIVVGTYNEFLLGYQLEEGNEERKQLKLTFADRSHAGSVKCLAVKGKWVATGGIDDRIFIYNMGRRKQEHVLVNHSGTVHSLVFSSDTTHLMSGGSDGRMIATRVGSWTVEGNWQKAHNRKPVNQIACHPSSRLALSLGGDQVLNTWNLVKGRIAYRTNLKNKRELGSAPDCLSWSTTGNHFTLSGPLAMEIFDIRTASVVLHIKMPSKPICVTWLDESTCLTGLENGSIAWISLEQDDNSDPHIISAHEDRVKAISFMADTLVTISSSGVLKVWKCESVADKELQLIAETNIECRPTCLGLLDLNQFAKQIQEQRHKKLPQTLQQANQNNEAAVDNSMPLRSFVSVEYDEGEDDSLDESKQDNSDNEEEEEEDDDSSEAESDDESEEDERKQKKRRNKSSLKPGSQQIVPANRKRPAAAAAKTSSKLKQMKRANK